MFWVDLQRPPERRDGGFDVTLIIQRGAKVGSKAGFDLTIDINKRDSIEFSVPTAPVIKGPRFENVHSALKDGPKSFQQLMGAINTRDGREVVLALDEIRQQNQLSRIEGGEYVLNN